MWLEDFYCRLPKAGFMKSCPRISYRSIRGVDSLYSIEPGSQKSTHAFWEAKEDAKEARGKRPSSAEAIHWRAANIRSARHKILQLRRASIDGAIPPIRHRDSYGSRITPKDLFSRCLTALE